MATRNLIVAITSDARGFSRGFSDAQRQVDGFGRSVGRQGGSISQFNGRVSALSASLGGLAVTLGGVFAATKIVDFAQDSVRAFSNLEESVNAVNVTFEEGADQILEFGQNAAQSVGLAQSAFNQSVIPIGALFRNFGFGADEAADSAIELTQRAADLASVFNVEVEDALLAVGSALRGESEPLRRFGADISAARVEAFLLGEGIVSSKSEIDEAAKVFGRYQLILQDTARVQGDFANTSDSYANRQRILAAEFENVQARIGEALLPVFEALLGAAPDAIEVLESFIPTIENVAKSFDSWGPAVFDAVAAVIQNLAEVPAAIQRLGLLVNEFAAEVGLAFLENVPILEAFTEGLQGQLERNIADFEQRLAVNRAIGIGIDLSFEQGAATAAANVLADLAAQGRLVNGAFEQVTGALGLDDREIKNVATALRDAGISALDFAPLIADINRELAQTAEAARLTGLAESVDVVEEAVDAYDEFYGVLQSTPDTDPLTDELEKLQESVIKTIDLFAEAPEEIEASVDDLINRAAARAQQNTRFQAALETLAAAGVDGVVRELQDAGPAAAGVAEDLANDIVRAFELEEQLEAEVGSALDVVSVAVSNATPSLARIFSETGIDLARALELGFTNEILSGGIAAAIAKAPNQGNASSGTRPTGGSGAITSSNRDDFLRAAGGPVSRNQAYIVGEKGPEWFVPNSNGTILPNGVSPGGGQTVNITVVSPEPVIEQDIQRAVLLSGISRAAEVTRI